MTTEKDKQGNTYRPDAQAFDEVRITTVPRYKESGLSGDEWRISAHVYFLRNGVVKHEFSTRNVETALALAPAEWLRAIGDGKAYFASEKHYCDQEGCSRKATVFYRRVKDWCSHCGEPKEISFRHSVRQFCEEHKKRGDCALDDADKNYELIQ